MWKNFKTRFDGILSSLQRHKQILDQCANLEQYHTYRANMEQIKSKLEQTIADEDNNKLKAVNAWLAPGQQQIADHEQVCTAREPGTGTTEWILKRDYIKDWLNASIVSTSLGWITGIPGAGILNDRQVFW
jgi:hypothetical protein